MPSEDGDWTFRVLNEYPRYGLEFFPGVFNEVLEDSLSHQKRPELVLGRCEMMQGRYEVLCKYKLFDQYRFEHLIFCLGTMLSNSKHLEDPKLSNLFRKTSYQTLLKQGYSISDIVDLQMALKIK